MLFPSIAFLALAFVPADCIPFDQAQKKVGETVCVTGKVLKVSTSARSGTQFLNFCEDYKNCPFTVVVFARDLRDVGDVRPLEGAVIEIHGKVKDYKGQAEIVLSDSRQLKGEAAKLPNLPKNFDVENQGKYSAGEFKSPTAPKTSHKKKPKDKIDTTTAEPDGPPPPQ
ncbi:MAG: nucleic acid binding, OB-fold, tRNA/helicase-type [Acidobacteriales bacterium]|nr:nucleic acid binding, OB-fold, tRNA/helicase-type [Terriglobales bacterium]